jgi:hypothetical protein
MNRLSMIFALTLGFGTAGCTAADDASNSDSEVATSVVSGALNNTNGSSVGYNVPRARSSAFARLVRTLSPVSEAHAAIWSCSGDTLSPAFAGPGDYAFTPMSCTVTWAPGFKVSSTWSGPFNLDYGASCDATHARIDGQAANCALTRTSAIGGETRTIEGPNHDTYAIDHDTNGAGSGWDSTVSPAPNDGGVVLTCGANGCDEGGSLVINGSHLTGTVATRRLTAKIWDHTLSTSPTGLVVTGGPGQRVVNGAVTLQHNILKYTATATFNQVGYGDPGCCFPTSGSVSTEFHGGQNVGKTESLAFGATCGDATFTNAAGVSTPIVLEHCL